MTLTPHPHHFQVNQTQDRELWDREVKQEVMERKAEYDVTVVKPYKEARKKYQVQLSVST